MESFVKIRLKRYSKGFSHSTYYLKMVSYYTKALKYVVRESDSPKLAQVM